MSRAVTSCCALLVLVAGFGGTSSAGPSLAGLSVQVVRTVTPPSNSTDPPQVDNFALTCDPPSGTLPFAERLCGDIREHPQAMLAPRDLIPSPRCPTPDIPGRPTVTFKIVIITSSGATTELSESPNCRDPGRVARNIFSAATYGDEGVIAKLERALGCDEDPVRLVFAKMTGTNRQACMFGSWTEVNRTMIESAERAPAIALLNPARLFPHNPGAQYCKMPLGGPAKGRSVRGQCGVYVTGATVSFVEDWSGKRLIWGNLSNGYFAPGQGSDSTRHTWDVVVVNGRVTSVTESGAALPQLKR